MTQRKTLPALRYSTGVGEYLLPPPTSAPKYCSKKHPCTALQSKNPTIVHPHSDVRKLLTREICPFLASYRLLLLTVYFSEPALGKDHKSILTPPQVDPQSYLGWSSPHSSGDPGGSLEAGQTWAQTQVLRQSGPGLGYLF